MQTIISTMASSLILSTSSPIPQHPSRSPAFLTTPF